VEIIEYECCGTSGRRYISKAEKVELLKQYKENLSNEIKGVEERINELKEES